MNDTPKDRSINLTENTDQKKEQTRLTKKKILIIEDEDSTSKFLSFRLEKLNFEILTAQDGQRGLKLAESEAPDLIILDLMLPKLPGEEICRSIKDSHNENLAAIPIIVVTAKDSIVDKVFGKAVGADAYITKPFNFEGLLKEINRFIS